MIGQSQLALDAGGATSGLVVSLPFVFPAYLSLREAGDMGPSGAAVQERRDALLERLGIDPARYITLKQTHSRSVRTADRNNRPPEGTEGDGLLTADPSFALGVTVADCMPIFLAAPDRNVFGVLHSGWRGTGIVGEAIGRAQREYGVRPRDLSVLLGPSIGPCCYRVDEERAKEFARLWGEQSVARIDDAPHLDLRRANLEIAESRGVVDVSVIGECTVCNEAFGSYRRQGAAEFTRMMAVVSGRSGKSTGE